jgi:hypothetical protein
LASGALIVTSHYSHPIAPRSRLKWTCLLIRIARCRSYRTSTREATSGIINISIAATRRECTTDTLGRASLCVIAGSKRDKSDRNGDRNPPAEVLSASKLTGEPNFPTPRLPGAVTRGTVLWHGTLTHFEGPEPGVPRIPLPLAPVSGRAPPECRHSRVEVADSDGAPRCTAVTDQLAEPPR